MQCAAVERTPKGTQLWVPIVDDQIRPTEGMIYGSLEDAITFYETYAEASGFDVRRSTERKNKDGSIKIKYMICSNAGYGRKCSIDTMEEQSSKSKRRRTNFKTTGCQASVRFQVIKGTTKFQLYHIEYRHNHMLSTEEDWCLSRRKRKLNYGEKAFIHRAGTSNMGPSKAHKVRTALRGGYDHVKSTTVEYKNFRRDMNIFVGERDAQMVINKMQDRQKVVPSFSFEYMTDENELTGLFWADEVGKLNYTEFGDVLSFDATFKSNKYSMVFVPFIGIDNHKKCVTFAAGLLRNENIESYRWLLKAFLKANQKQPRLVLTDQDPAMKVAISCEFPESHHRLCMWHITNKVPSKVLSDGVRDTEFKKRFNNLIWDENIDPEEFDSEWNKIIEEFGLQDNRWLSDMFAIRTKWIPAFFKDIGMSGLMKTTSRSESTNSYFNNFSHYGNTLVHFLLSFEVAMEKQRHKQHEMDHASRSTTPKLRTPLKLESQAAVTYTRSVFKYVQDDISDSVWSCLIKDVRISGDLVTCIVEDKTKVPPSMSEFQVSFNEKTGSIECRCMHFFRVGLLCKHIYKVLSNQGVESVPEKYILRRWRKDIMPQGMTKGFGKVFQSDFEIDKLSNEAQSACEICVGIYRFDKEKLERFTEKMKELKNEAEIFLKDIGCVTDKDFMSRLLGVSEPSTVDVYAPQGVRNKGCGTGKRLIGAGEKAKAKSSKPKRTCKSCGKLCNHDSRNCPSKIAMTDSEE